MSKQSAILVDYELFADNPVLRGWLLVKQLSAKIILLVSNPDDRDFAHEVWPDFEVDAVLRNHKHTLDIAFKTAALCVMQDSLVDPVVAIDDDPLVVDMYESGGVLITIGSKAFE